MNTREEAREVLAHHRQHEEKTQAAMRKRAEAEVEKPSEAHAEMASETRESMAHQRQHQEHVQESMLKRSETEIGLEQSAEA